LKRVAITHKYGEWHLAFCLERRDLPSNPKGLPAIGVDRGVEIALMTSDSQVFEQTMWKPTEKRRLLALERRKSRQHKGSHHFRQTSVTTLSTPSRTAHQRRSRHNHRLQQQQHQHRSLATSCTRPTGPKG
jgi:putative transposase